MAHEFIKHVIERLAYINISYAQHVGSIGKNFGTLPTEQDVTPLGIITQLFLNVDSNLKAQDELHQHAMLLCDELVKVDSRRLQVNLVNYLNSVVKTTSQMLVTLEAALQDKVFPVEPIEVKIRQKPEVLTPEQIYSRIELLLTEALRQVREAYEKTDQQNLTLRFDGEILGKGHHMCRGLKREKLYVAHVHSNLGFQIEQFGMHSIKEQQLLSVYMKWHIEDYAHRVTRHQNEQLAAVIAASKRTEQSINLKELVKLQAAEEIEKVLQPLYKRLRFLEQERAATVPEPQAPTSPVNIRSRGGQRTKRRA